MVKCLACIHPRMLRSPVLTIVKKNAHHKPGVRYYISNAVVIEPGAKNITESSGRLSMDSGRMNEITAGTNHVPRNRDPGSFDSISVRLDMSFLQGLLSQSSGSTLPQPSIYTILSAVNSLASHHFHLLNSNNISRLITLLGSYAIQFQFESFKAHNFPVSLLQDLPLPDKSAVSQCWNALRIIINSKQQLRGYLEDEDLLWICCHDIILSEAGDFPDMQRNLAMKLAEQISQIRGSRFLAFLLRRLEMNSSPATILHICNYLSDTLSRHHSLPQPFVGLLSVVVNHPSVTLSSRHQETLLTAILRHVALHSEPSQSGHIRNEVQVASIKQLHCQFQLAIVDRAMMRCPQSLSRWIKDSVDANLTSSLTLDRRWTFLRSILSPSLIHEDVAGSSPLTSHSTCLSLAEIISSLRRWDLLREENPAFTPIPDDVRKLWQDFCTLNSRSQKETHKTALRLVHLSFLQLASISRDQELFRRVLQKGSELGAVSMDEDRNFLLAIAVEFGCALVGFGVRNWHQLQDDLHSLNIKPGSMKEIASRIVAKWARQDAAVAHDLYLATCSESFRITTPAISLLLRECLQRGEVGRAITCAADQSVSLKQRWHLVNFIADYLHTHDIRYLHFDSAIMLGETMSQVVVQTGIQQERREHWETALLLVQRSCVADVGSTAVRHMVVNWPHFWNGSFLFKFGRGLVREHPRAAVEIALQFPRARSDFSLFRRSIVEWLALKRRPLFARRLWATLEPQEKQTATLFQRILAAIRFEYRSPAAPCVFAAVRFLLSASQITERDLNLVLFLLVRARKNALARRLLLRIQASGKLPGPTPSTTTLNILLGSAVLPSRGFRGPRQIRKVTRFFHELFVLSNVIPDPITLNLMFKSVLRWRSITSNQLRRLFNRCIISGYPGNSSQGLPFDDLSIPSTMSPDSPSYRDHQQEGSHPSSSLFGATAPSLSYERHIKPLYKMFIKAFTVRGDDSAARIVVQLLKRARAIAQSGGDCSPSRKSHAAQPGE